MKSQEKLLQEEISRLQKSLSSANERIIQLISERDNFQMEAERRWALRKEIEELLEVGDSYEDGVKKKAIEKIRAMKTGLSEAREAGERLAGALRLRRQMEGQQAPTKYEVEALDSWGKERGRRSYDRAGGRGRFALG